MALGQLPGDTEVSPHPVPRRPSSGSSLFDWVMLVLSRPSPGSRSGRGTQSGRCRLPGLDVCHQPDRLAGDGGDRLGVVIVTQDCQGLLLGCGRGQQGPRPGGPVLTALGRQLLPPPSAVEAPVAPRPPAENGTQQPLLLQPVSQRP